jgi:basic amino acid/polyamine antiporter, APA family
MYIRRARFGGSPAPRVIMRHGPRHASTDTHRTQFTRPRRGPGGGDKSGSGKRTRGVLLRVLGTAFGLAVIVGNMIGSGILRTPGSVAELLPAPGLYLMVWVLGAVYALLGANALCELAAMLPRAGGQYNYARHALGPYAGFVVGWNDWLSTAGSAGAVALVLAASVGELVPGLAAAEKAVAGLVIAGFTVLLWRGVREGARAQLVTSLMKAIAFVVLIAAAGVYIATNGVAGEAVAGAARAATTVPVGMALAAAFAVAMQSVIFTYDGWSGAVYFAEEVTDPGRNIPRATFRGIAAVTAIYLLINLVYVGVLGVQRMAGDSMVAATVAQDIFGANGEMIIHAIVVLALLSSVNALLPLSSRVYFAMSRDGLAPAGAQNVNPGGTPTVALLTTAVVAIVFLLSGTFGAVIAVLTFFFVATYAISFASVFVLRRREPDAPRPYRSKWHPWSTALGLVASVAFLVGTVVSDRRNGLIALVLVALSYPMYLAAARAFGGSSSASD